MLKDNTDVLHKIGTLGEKTLHSELKHIYEPDIEKHEIKIDGFHADILNEDGIIEIQTAGFNLLRKKLGVLLKTNIVTIVYPIAQTKYLVWIDPDTLKSSKPRKSPRSGKVYDIFRELYKLRSFLNHENIRFSIALMDIVEYRYLDGYAKDGKKGSSRCDRTIQNFNKRVDICSQSEYIKLVPETLPDLFDSQDFKRASGLSINGARIALLLLKEARVIEQTGKKGNTYLYQKAYN